MKSQKNLTVSYALVQAAYWMNFCLTSGFAAVFLQGLGYNNAELGVVLAVGNLLGAVLGPVLSSLIDRHRAITPARLIVPLLALETGSLILLLFVPSKGLAASAGYVFFIAFCIALNSMYLKLYVDLLHSGAYINYGVARGMGSFAYVLMSVGLGAVIEAVGIRSMPVGGIILVCLQIIALFIILRLAPKGEAAAGSDSGSGLLRFIKDNPRYFIMLLGTALIFFSHNALCNFLINVTRAVGGDTGTMGYLNGFMAAVEIPVMLLFAKVFGKKNSGTLLRVSFVFFTLKAAAMALASSVPTLFAAFVLQAPSYALYTSAVVPYVERTIAYEDSAKAQSLAFTMTTVGSVMASVIAGRLYDVMPPASVLWVAAAFCAVGTATAVIGVKSEKKS